MHKFKIKNTINKKILKHHLGKSDIEFDISVKNENVIFMPLHHDTG